MTLTQEEYYTKLATFSASDAPLDVKEKAILKLKEENPQYAGVSNKIARINIQIEESMADSYDVFSGE